MEEFLVSMKFKTIAIAVAVVMVLTVFAPVIYGIEDSIKSEDIEDILAEENQSGEEQALEEETAIEDILILGEDISKRELDTKYFVLENGAEIAAIYPYNVHYEKEDGKLENIDNSLQNTKDEEKEDVLANKANGFDVKFAKKSNKNKLISMKSKEYKLDWSLQGANKVEAKTSIPKKDKKLLLDIKERNAEKMTVDNLLSTITYEEILNKVDLQYDMQADVIKESIILKDKEAIKNNFVFNLDTGKLKAYKTEANEIIVYDGDKENIVYIMNPMFMFDSNQEYSDKVEMVLEETKNKGYTLTIIPDKQ